MATALTYMEVFEEYCMVVVAAASSIAVASGECTSYNSS